MKIRTGKPVRSVSVLPDGTLSSRNRVYALIAKRPRLGWCCGEAEDGRVKEGPALIETVADRCDYSLFMVPIRLYRFQMMTVVAPSFPPSLCFPVIPSFALVYLIFFSRLSAFLVLLISPISPPPHSETLFLSAVPF